MGLSDVIDSAFGFALSLDVPSGDEGSEDVFGGDVEE